MKKQLIVVSLIFSCLIGKNSLAMKGFGQIAKQPTIPTQEQNEMEVFMHMVVMKKVLCLHQKVYICLQLSPQTRDLLQKKYTNKREGLSAELVKAYNNQNDKEIEKINKELKYVMNELAVLNIANNASL